MPTVTITKPFKFAHRGVEVEEFEPSAEPRETTDEVAAWVVENGFGELVPSPAPTPGEQAAAEKAPENKDAAPRRTKKS